jgi:hypothetical protein
MGGRINLINVITRLYVTYPNVEKVKGSEYFPKVLYIQKYMDTPEELSDFQHGTVIGCHLLQQVSALIEPSRSTVSAVIVKWKRLGATTAQPRSGRPHKLTERSV